MELIKEFRHRLQMTKSVVRAQWRRDQCTRACSESHTMTIGCVLRPPAQWTDEPDDHPLGRYARNSADKAEAEPDVNFPPGKLTITTDHPLANRYMADLQRRARDWAGAENLRIGLAKELIVEADGLLTLILYREPNGLSDRTKNDIDDLVFRLREWL